MLWPMPFLECIRSCGGSVWSLPALKVHIYCSAVNHAVYFCNKLGVVFLNKHVYCCDVICLFLVVDVLCMPAWTKV